MSGGGVSPPFRPLSHQDSVHAAQESRRGSAHGSGVESHQTVTICPDARESAWTRARTYGIIMVTLVARSRRAPSTDPKVAALRAAGALHPRPSAVRDEAFLRHPFFDARDRVQVKYEMLRRHDIDQRPVTEVAARFGVSRQAFYEAQTAFAKGGLPGLVPKRPGPKRASKCTDAILTFAERWLAEGPDRSVAALAGAVRDRFDATIHPRSLQRALARRKKKRPPLESNR